MDLRFDNSPPITVVQITSGFLTSSTRNTIRPLFRSILSPGTICSHIPSKETETLFSLPIMSSVVKVNLSPFLRVILPFSNVLILNSGPFVSSIMAIGCFFWSLIFLIVAIFFACSSCVPCEKFSLATFIPASIIWESTSSLSLAGPSVQIIFVFFIKNSYMKYRYILKTDIF